MLFHIKGRDGIWLLFVKETRRFPVGFPAIKVPFCITICMLGNFACFFVVYGFFFFFFFFFKLTFSKTSIGNTIRVSNSLNPDQARHFVGPDLGPNCLQRLSAEDKSCC